MKAGRAKKGPVPSSSTADTDALTAACTALAEEAQGLPPGPLNVALKNIGGLGWCVEATTDVGRADHLETVLEAANAARQLAALATPGDVFRGLRSELEAARMAVTDLAMAEGTIDEAIHELGRRALRAVREAEMILDADDRRVAEVTS